MVYDDNRILHPNGTIEFRVLLERADVSVDGIEYYCQLSNAFGSVISRTALLQAASKLINLLYCIATVFIYIAMYCSYQ